jgi:glycosyltransferase involved in cell wall biosynthesis
MTKHRELKVMYLSGPVDAHKVYQVWSSGRRQEYFGTSYMAQFFQTCEELNAEGYVFTTATDRIQDRDEAHFHFINRPFPTKHSGIRYHIAMCIWFLRLYPWLVVVRPNVLILTAGQNYWFTLSPLKLFGVKIVAALHSALWPKFLPKRRSLQILLALNSVFYVYCVSAAIVASKDIEKQLRSLARGRLPNIQVFLPTYDRAQFKEISLPDIKSSVFNVLYAGRIEENKGVYVLLGAAAMLQSRFPGRYKFEVCGEGSELAALKGRALQLGLESVFVCRGFCTSDILKEAFADAHIVVVPSTTKVEEGFAMICAEAILSGRPVVTSDVCPALEYVRSAALEVEADSVQEYALAIEKVSKDKELWSELHASCLLLSEQFYDKRNCWAAKLRQVVKPDLPPNVAF